MTQPMTRDELARHLYIRGCDDDYVRAHGEQGVPQTWRDMGAEEWDAGLVTDDDVKDCYARADRMIAEGANR
jgi:hypothetical protein